MKQIFVVNWRHSHREKDLWTSDACDIKKKKKVDETTIRVILILTRSKSGTRLESHVPCFAPVGDS